MNSNILSLIVLVLAAIPCGLFLANLLVYRTTPKRRSTEPTPLSVLIPARNEEANIRLTLESVLANADAEFEVIVLDDHSTDRTAAIVSELATEDNRLRLEPAPPLPPDWCGKQHACYVLAGLARNPLLVFIDADVRMEVDALARLANFMEESGADLASGVPRQELVSFSEQLLIPLIHFILLGFLPMHAMRRSRLPSLSAGCGQLFIARRDAYQACGGHAQIRDSLHDGIKLPRIFRHAGFATDLFDATDLAVCRMYRVDSEVWRGLGKNATEGLAAPKTILPMTALLLGGQVMPFVLLLFSASFSTLGITLISLACVLSLLPRVIAARRFRQPLVGALLHPLGVIALLGIQWFALIREMLGRPAVWKGRAYHTCKSATPLPLNSHQ